MFYYKVVEDNQIVGYAKLTEECLFETHIPITEDEFNQETRKNEIAALNERRAQLLEEQKTETDELNLLLIKRELEDINAYLEGKE